MARRFGTSRALACLFSVLVLGACGSSGGSGGAHRVDVGLTEFKVGVSTTLPRARTTLRIANHGKAAHELLVFRPEGEVSANTLPVDAKGDVNEDAPGVNKISDGDNIAPGKGQTRAVDLTQPGTYVFVCNLPGHYRAGMHTIVTVR